MKEALQALIAKLVKSRDEEDTETGHWHADGYLVELVQLLAADRALEERELVDEALKVYDEVHKWFA